MRFRTLGPLEVRSPDGVARRPRGEKQRLLLATLLLHAPRAASADRLVDALWRERPPARPGAALRTQVSRLRALLADCGIDPTTLRAEPHGYRLAIAREEIDLGGFEAAQRGARDAADPGAALDALERALALWRGDPFEECAALPQFLGEVVRLQELRTGARERRSECLLALGRVAEALGEAEAMAREDPMRERPRALCMTALHRLGRRPEALAVFQEFRRLLSQELGLDPSPALRQLESEILRDEAPARIVSPAPAMPDERREAGGATPPAGRTSGAVARVQPRLPIAMTRLIGRERERASVRRLLESMRVVTLTGAGGSGKTRLALEVAHDVQDGAAREVAWIRLEATTDPGFVAQEVADALGARAHAGRTPTEALVELLATRAVLLVLDNCEQVVEACARLVAALLGACPDLVVLATSREPLGVAGEATWPVPPLPVPAVDQVDARALARSEAVQLFVDRARATLPSFDLTDENAASVARICRRLDGIPLALELAAARVRALRAAEIADHLDRDLALLSTGNRAALPRHQTLRAAIDWSLQLLSAPERLLLERLSVFAGGFTLEAATAVCADDASIAPSAVLDLVCALVDKSLLVTLRAGGTTRYRLLETVRSRAGEHLQAGEGDAALRLRHAEHFAALAEEAEPKLVSSARAETGRRLAADQENIRAALAWALSEPRGAVAAYRLAGSLWWFWHYVGRFAEARHWAEAVLALQADDVPDRLRARVRYTAAMACWLVGDPTAALPHGEESARIARTLDEPSLLVRALSAHAFALRDVGEMAPARALASECVAVARNAGFPPTEMGFALWIQCTALLTTGEVEPAEAAAREAEALWRATGDRWGLSMVLHGLAMARLGVGELEAAAAHFREAVELLREDGEPYFIARSIEGLAIARVHQGHADVASRLFGAAEAIRESIGAPLMVSEEARYRQTISILAPLLESQRREAAWAEGRAMALPQVVAYVLDDAPGDAPVDARASQSG